MIGVGGAYSTGLELRLIQGARIGRKKISSKMFALLNATKDAWRNPTMHIEKKYTEEEAETIFFAVRSLMKRLVSRMDENGLPLA
jgi:hypothetical protein